MDSSNNSTWRSGMTLAYRQTLVDSIVGTIHNHMPPTSEETITETLEVSRAFEDVVFLSATDLDNYLQTIFKKEEELLEKHHEGARQDLKLTHLQEQLLLDLQHQQEQQQLLQQQKLEEQNEANSLLDLQYRQEQQKLKGQNETNTAENTPAGTTQPGACAGM